MNITSLEFIGRKLRPIEIGLLAKWVLRIKRVIYELPDNTKFYIDPISDFGLTLTKQNSYEVDMTNEVISILVEGDSFIDLGSNEGFFSIIASKIVGEQGRVFSIEPQQRLWEIIIKNVSLNKCNNIQLLPYGISSKAGEATIHLYPSLNSGASSLSNNFNFKISFSRIRKIFYGQQRICVKTFNDLENCFPQKIKLIKIDIEGHEFEALKGASVLLEKKKIDQILVEIHPEALFSMNQSESDIAIYLASFGYKIKKRISENLILFSAT